MNSKINQILFVLMLLFVSVKFNSVFAKTYTSYSIGDTVKLSKGTDITSNWIVIKSSDSSEDTVKLFKQYNAFFNIPFSSSSTNDYLASTIKTKTDNYGESLNLGNALHSIGLITIKELKSLGCSNSSCTSAPRWVYNSGYWTSTPASNRGYIYRVGYNGNIAAASYQDTYYGLRPVIVVSKDVVLNGYTNDEKEFDEILIVCPDKVKSGEEFTCYIGIDKDVDKINFDLSISGSAKIEYSIKLDNWNEELPEVNKNENDYSYENISLSKKEGNENTELLSITIKPEISKEDKYKTIALSNIELYDEVGDYQNIEKLEKRVDINKYIEIVENPKTGNSSYKTILLFIVSLGSVLIILMYKRLCILK